MALDLDVVVHVDASRLPVGKLVRLQRQGPQNRPVERFEQAGAGARALAERALVEPLEEFGDGLVELSEARESAVAECRQNPAFDQLHSGLDLSLVARLARTSGHDSHAVVRRHLLMGAVEIGLVTAGAAHPGAKVVGDNDLWYAAEELEGAHVRAGPVRQILTPSGLGVGVGTGPEYGHKNLRRTDFACLQVLDRDGRPGVVNEELFAGAVLLAENDVELAPPALVEFAETAVAVAVGMSFDVLFPQQLQGHVPVRLQLLMNRGEVGFGAALTWRPRHTSAEQTLFELSLVAVRRRGP